MSESSKCCTKCEYEFPVAFNPYCRDCVRHNKFVPKGGGTLGKEILEKFIEGEVSANSVLRAFGLPPIKESEEDLDKWNHIRELHGLKPVDPYDCGPANAEVFVIGSISQEDEITHLAELYRKRGLTVDHVKKQPDKSFGDLVDEAFQKISKADKIIVVLKKDGSIGEGVTYEVAFAKFLGKKIDFI